MASSPLAGLDQFQGVWFPTHQSDDGRLWAVHEPAFPSPGGTPWLLTVQGDAFHVTANADYYATGGWIRLGPEPGRLTFVYGMVPAEYAEYHGRFAYRLDGGELHLQSGGLPWSRPGDWVTAARYVRVAAGPSPEMAALFGAVTRHPPWNNEGGPTPAERLAAPDTGREKR